MTWIEVARKGRNKRWHDDAMRSSANVELRKPIADRWENGNGGDDKDDNKQHYNPLAMWPCFKGSPNFQENKLLLGFQLTHQPSLVFTIIKLQNTTCKLANK